MMIEVTQAMIDEGEPGDCGKCPVALGVLAAYPGSTVEVADDGISVTPEDCLFPGPDTVYYDTPDGVGGFVRSYDCGLRVVPFSFELGEPVAMFDLHGDALPTETEGLRDE